MGEHDGEARRGRPEDRKLKPQIMMKGYRIMSNALSSEILAKLRAAEGEGLSHDPKNNPPKIVQLLQDKAVGSSWCPSGARAGQYLIGDTLYDDFVWTPIKFKDTFMEWTVKPRGYVTTHDALPEDASWDAKARCWFRPNGNSVEEAAEILGLINGEVCTQSFSLSALAVARSLNSAASKLTAETDGPPIRLATTAMSEVKTNAGLARGISDNAQPPIDTLLEIYLQWRGTLLPDPAPTCLGGRKQRFYVLKPAIFEGWDEAVEMPSEHLEHQAHIKMKVSQNRGSQE
jgi:hypothetical protein